MRHLAPLVTLFALFACEASTECGSEFYSNATQTQLLNSTDADALILGAIVSDSSRMMIAAGASEDDEPGTALRSSEVFLQKGLDLHPENTVLLQRIIGFCQRREYATEHPSLCKAQHEQHLLALDPENGLYWVYLTQRLLEEGDYANALKALQRAATAPLFHMDWPAQVSSFKGVIDREFPGQAQCSALLAGGVSQITNLTPLSGACHSRIDDAVWRDACLQIGAVMEQKGQTIVTPRLGMAIQRTVLKATKNIAALDQLEERKATLDELMKRYAKVSTCVAEGGRTELWLKDLADHGEIETMRRAVARGSACEA